MAFLSGVHYRLPVGTINSAQTLKATATQTATLTLTLTLTVNSAQTPKARVQRLVNNRPSGRHTRWTEFFLGVMYDNGRGVPQDFIKAAKWYKLAAAKGNSKAQCNLGLMYNKVRCASPSSSQRPP
jgi:TPR repeat protein